MELLLARGLGAVLHPADPESEAALLKLGRGEVLKVIARRPRNVAHHRKFFALVGLLFDNQEQFRDREQFRRALLIEAGHFDDQKLLDGSVVRTAKSINFASCDQSEFEKIYDSVVYVALEKLVPGCSREDLEQEVEAFVSRRW